MPVQGEKVHSRTIEISTYAQDKDKVIVEGLLKDERFQETHVPTGEKFPRGIMHHLGIRLLVNCSSMMIEEVDVKLFQVPRAFCLETADCLAPIKGMQISRGFSKRLKELVGGTKGCAHLVELLQAMAPAVFQGVAAYRSKKLVKLDTKTLQMVYNRLVNSCHVWREGGPIAKAIKQKLSTP
ncbi:MAG TPA: DUF2889 domain-containing protein [Syntrophales bacterium]|nr:DUF2889 domain-containing protein [Syntrophales bacterium]HOL58458.1 DUF2889 domain-containing protein [Syntrophales bacterium]HPO34933.1 DUF2889 domain-containing protein [Syntrophales bacterium]